MNKKDKIKLDALSNIDDEIIDKASEIRCFWLMNVRKKIKKSRIWLRVVSIAACICLIFGGGLFGILHFFGKQIPVYMGMTVSSMLDENASVAKMPEFENDLERLAHKTVSSMLDENASVAKMPEFENDLERLAHKVVLLDYLKNDEKVKDDEHNKNDKNDKIDKFEENIDSLNIQGSNELYYAKPNTDIYITVHIDNPDSFEILSFTLNGNKYSSYMFEKNSDMENLILKVNIGDVEGIVSYTIDAIKYVDGNRIKDVRMEGNRVVRIGVESANNIGASFVATVDDSTVLSNGKLYAILYEGDDLIQKKEVFVGDTVTFEYLRPDTLYKYMLVVLYDAIDDEKKESHVLYEKSFYVEKVVEIQTSKLIGVDVLLSANWSENYTGTKQFDSLALYDGENKIRDLDVNSTKVSNLPFDKELSLVATYTANGQKFTIRCSIESPQSSKGLQMMGGVVTGMGTCQDTILYINAPIGENAFAGNQHLKEIYLGEGVKSIDFGAFQQCTNITTVKLLNGVETIDHMVFYRTKLKNITIPNSVKMIGKSVFYENSIISNVTFENTSGWYLSSDGAKVGKSIDVTDSEQNARNLREPPRNPLSAPYLKRD